MLSGDAATLSREAVRVAVLAYTDYASDPRVKAEAEAALSAGFEVHVFSARTQTAAAAQAISGVKVHQLALTIVKGSKARYLYQYALFFALSGCLLVSTHRREHFSIVHVHSLPDFQVFSALGLWLLGIPVILDLHEAFPEILRARFGGPPRGIWFQLSVLAERMSCLFAKRVVAANDGIRDAVVKRGIPPSHVICIYTSPSSAGIEGVGSSTEMHAMPPGRLIVHAGGINEERDLETLVKALAILRDTCDIGLVLVGKGEAGYIAGLAALAETLQVGDRVHYVGQVSTAEASALLSRSELGVVTLKANPLTELAWPSRVMEFAALGKPLVLPRLGFLAKTLGTAAFYYDPGDPRSLASKIATALTDTQTSQVKARKAALVCLRLRGNGMVNALGALYREVLGN